MGASGYQRMTNNKPRSIKGKREQSENAWKQWNEKQINGIERDRLSMPFLRLAGLESGAPNDVDTVLAARREVQRAEYAARRAEMAAENQRQESKRLLRNAARRKDENNRLRGYAQAEKAAQKVDVWLAKAEERKTVATVKEREVSQTKERIREKERKISDSALPGMLKTQRDMQQSLIKGKKTEADVADSVQRYRDANERTKRAAIENKEAKEAIRKRDNYRRINERQPGTEWGGGQLRSGSIAGEVMQPEMAALNFADKYHRSSMPGKDIVPNVNVRGENEAGEIIETKVPLKIIEQIARESKAGSQPDTRKLLQWLRMFCDEEQIEDIDLFADDADLFDT